ncbi:MAG: UDP-N-acetylglucosamine 1-carboxyvinyltransferase [Deltaproteobacteria bacterium]|nr:UDP-N-acetylglucosamine 1-carboxyvinyltransferase [Deltaproteobacteria bacterium]MBW2122571.1 UDP-N-acetylglucosamine 1-carboxyvinyltransferase [Deltaproteobacteria bacterium]
MEKIIIEGGNRLIGDVKISGSKNAALPLFAAAILCHSPTVYHNVPHLRDVVTIQRVLRNLGVQIENNPDGSVRIDSSALSGHEAPYELVKTMRASILVLGPLVARMGRAVVSLPGGCAIGARPVNLHLRGLEVLGAKIRLDHGYISAEAERLKGGHLCLDVPTVTGTENLMMAAALAEGTTVIENAAQEPEVAELARVLNKMGARISGAGTSTLRIDGVEGLEGTDHTIMADRIEAGTFMVAAGLTQGNLSLLNCPMPHLEAVVRKLGEAGLEIYQDGEAVRVVGTRRIRSVDVKTLPYPGFPTDMQAQTMVLMCLARGLSVICETVFENRFIHVSELRRMGADIKVNSNSAIVTGVKRLSGAEVMATDLRASASLVLAGLAAEGVTKVSRVYHLDRGYEDLEKKLLRLGARIKRVQEH